VSAPFKVGDLVRLKNSWGPVMTVAHIQDAEQAGNKIFAIRCLWFDAVTHLLEAVIDSAVLELAGPE
jgi:uncharacterized protein YodC (DUF2158 family)